MRTSPATSATSGTKQQTIDRLYGGSAAQWTKYDPTTVMHAHGPYTGVSGWFEDTGTQQSWHRNPNWKGNGHHPGRPGGFAPPQRTNQAPNGFGGHDNTGNADESGAAQKLCAEARTVDISCSVHTAPGGHTWQFATAALPAALPWMAAQLHTPGSAPAPSPAVHLASAAH